MRSSLQYEPLHLVLHIENVTTFGPRKFSPVELVLHTAYNIYGAAVQGAFSSLSYHSLHEGSPWQQIFRHPARAASML